MTMIMLMMITYNQQSNKCTDFVLIANISEVWIERTYTPPSYICLSAVARSNKLYIVVNHRLKQMNALNINFCLSHVKSSLPASFFYLCDLISVQPPRSTRFSFFSHHLYRLCTFSSLKITNISFRYSAPYLWNQLPESFREHHPHLAVSASESHFLSPARSRFSSASPLSPSIIPYFHSKLKTHLFHKVFPP